MNKINDLIKSTSIHFILGSLFLISCSLFQKIFAGFNPFVLKGYFVPFLFGGFTGLLLGRYIRKSAELRAMLEERVCNLEKLLPICSNCKKIRLPDSDPSQISSWESVESYISKKTNSNLTHGICPECADKHYPDLNVYNDEN